MDVANVENWIMAGGRVPTLMQPDDGFHLRHHSNSNSDTNSSESGDSQHSSQEHLHLHWVSVIKLRPVHQRRKCSLRRHIP